MAVLSWGKPTVEICAYVNGALPATPTYSPLPEIKEDSAKLATTKGTKLEAKQEGGALVDARYTANGYSFECEIFVKKGDVRTIEDIDGIVSDNYALRLTPEDDDNEGFLMEKTSVSVEETWSSKDGKLLKYTFEGLKPASGKICKPYTKI